MKVLLLLSVALAVSLASFVGPYQSASSSSSFSSSTGGQSSTSFYGRGGGTVITQGQGVSLGAHVVPSVTNGHYVYAPVHLSTRSSDYHFSWLADYNGKYSWQDAMNYCRNLGPEWYGVSVETQEENYLIIRIIDGYNLKYSWSGGYLSGYDWKWLSGGYFTPLNWGQTGAQGLPQPDNNEGEEYCLAYLNRFYDYDGITWHDIACHHLKPVICERPRTYRPYYGHRYYRG
ncbi:uncharacterized protein [Panulirus ornatus]|uniref:uncharacterized protein n=1 Tax=Panulirus ornatus TaxID=150431 RepID=UPI003A8B9F56